MFKFYRILVLFTTVTSFSVITYGSENCFIAKENGKIVKQIGKCEKRHSPFSTFKIPLAIMGFDSGILTSKEAPAIDCDAEIEKSYITYYNPQKYPIMLLWKRTQTPESWMRNSVVWYSRFITHRLGMKKLQKYVNKFNYGNKNITGEPDKNDGLMNSWLDSSLEISALEQVTFIESLMNKKLSVSYQAQENTKTIIKLENIFGDWKLYGKTGGAIKLGWFVGWVEKNGRHIAFAQYIEQPEDALISGGRVAKEVAKDNLISLILK